MGRLAAQIEYLADEEARYKTFKKWPFSSNEKCNARKMAEAGFIFNGSPSHLDWVECFHCKKALDGWEASDDPWAEHLKHSESCEFAKMQKPIREWTVNEVINFLERAAKKEVCRLFDSLMQ